MDKAVIIRDDKGKFIKGASGQGKPIKSSADGRRLAELRWQKFRQTAASRVVQEAASIDPSVKTPADAWGLVTARQFSALMDSDKPRGDDLLAIGRAIGAMPNDADKMQAIQTQTQRQTQPDIVLALLALVGGDAFDNSNYRNQDDDTIEGETVGAGDSDGE